MIVGALVLVEVTAGITDASMTRRPSRPCTRNSLSTTDNVRGLEVARAQPGIENARLQQGQVWFTADGENTVAELSQALVEAGALIVALTPQTATLEQLFFSLTEGPEDGDGAAAPAQEEAAEVAT